MILPKSSPKPKKPKLFLLRRVSGESMAPTIRPGSFVVGVYPRAIKLGDVVVVWHNGIDKIKRVADISASKVFLVGDNPTHSTDSRDFGWIDRDAVLARVIWISAT